MTKWIYRAVGTVGVAAGGALLLAGGAAQADGIDAPVNDLRGSLDGFFTPMGDHDLVSAIPDLAAGQHLGFLAAVPASPTAGVDPAALEAAPAPAALDNGDGLSLLSLGDMKITSSTVTDALSSGGPLVSDTGGGQLIKGSVQPSGSLPLLGNPLGLGTQPTEDEPLGDDNLNTIGSDSQMRTPGSTVGVDQLVGLDQFGLGAGLGDFGRGGGLDGGPLGEPGEHPLGMGGKHAAPDHGDFDIADLRGSGLDTVGRSLVPPLIGEALEAEMGEGFLAGPSVDGLTEADDSMIGLPLIGQLPLAAFNSSDPNGPLGDLSSPLDILSATGGPAAQPAAQSPAPTPARTGQPATDDGASRQGGHRPWSRSSSERPVAGEDADFR